MNKESSVYQFITKMNEAKTMRTRWLELYDEFRELIKQLSEEDVRSLFKYVSDLVVSDVVVGGLAECWAESMQYYHILNPDKEMPLQSEENQNSWYIKGILKEIELMNRSEG